MSESNSLIKKSCQIYLLPRIFRQVLPIIYKEFYFALWMIMANKFPEATAKKIFV